MMASVMPDRYETTLVYNPRSTLTDHQSLVASFEGRDAPTHRSHHTSKRTLQSAQFPDPRTCHTIRKSRLCCSARTCTRDARYSSNREALRLDTNEMA
jgi:hypothetical protein